MKRPNYNHHHNNISIILLDTVWIGTRSSHILVLHDQELLTWYKPYHVCSLTCVTSTGPCRMEKCVVEGGGGERRGSVHTAEIFSYNVGSL